MEIQQKQETIKREMDETYASWDRLSEQLAGMAAD
jgi:hypothetical protein